MINSIAVKLRGCLNYSKITENLQTLIEKAVQKIIKVIHPIAKIVINKNIEIPMAM